MGSIYIHLAAHICAQRSTLQFSSTLYENGLIQAFSDLNLRCRCRKHSVCDIPGSIATLAQRWPNVKPYVGPKSAHQRWANVDLSIGPTLAQRWRASVGPTLAQHRPTNVGPTLTQRYANGCMPTLYQHWPNGGCVTGFLWGEPIGHRLIPLTKGQERWRWCLPKQSVEQTVELGKRWFETPMWSTSM